MSTDSAAVHVAIAPFDLTRTFALQQLGRFDPTARLDALALIKWFAHAGGTSRLAVRRVSTGVELSAEPGDAELLARWHPAWSVDDGHAAFEPEPRLLRLHRAYTGMRLVRVPWLFDVACGAILQQRVTFQEAMSCWKRLAMAHGTRTASGEFAFPSPAQITALPSWSYPALRIDPRRGRALYAQARAELAHPFLDLASDHATLRKRLLAVPGVGPWTTEMTLGFGAADPDALPVGDLHLPHLVAQALGKGPRGSDAQMVEWLEPYRGQRFRVARLALAHAFAARRR